MKKLLIAVLAIAGLASCTNSDVEYDPVQKQIGLSPITENRTRAMYTESGANFPDEQFVVWAWYKQLPAGKSIDYWQASTTVAQQDYIVEKPFKKSGSVWSGANAAYYWPKLGSLLFAGYYPTNAEDKTNGGITYDFGRLENVMTINKYTPGDYATTGFVNTTTPYEEDLMYFKMTEASVNCATTAETDVDVKFQHALAWIKVTLAKAEGTPANAKINVKSVTFTDVKTTGTGTVEDRADIAWDVTGSATADIVVWNDAATALTTTPNTDAKEPVVIPQEMSGNLVIVYTITSGDDSMFEETKTITLNSLKDDAATPNTIEKWEAGKCYTYAIAIGTSEITVAPSVDAWVDVKVPVAVQ